MSSPPPAEEESGEDFVTIAIIAAVGALLILTIVLYCCRARRRRTIHKHARQLASKEFGDRLHALNQAIMGIVVQGLQEEMARVTPPVMLAGDAIGSSVPHPSQAASVASDGASDTGSVVASKRRMLLTPKDQSQQVANIVNDAISDMQVQALTKGTDFGVGGTRGDAARVMTHTDLVALLQRNERVLKHAQEASTKVYRSIREAVKAQLDDLIYVPVAKTGSPDEAGETAAATRAEQVKRDREYEKKHMPVACCCYRLACMCRGQEIDTAHDYRRVFFYDFARKLGSGMGVDETASAKKDKKKKDDKKKDDEGDEEMTSGVMMSTKLYNSTGYVQQGLIHLYAASKGLVKRHSNGTNEVLASSCMLGMTESRLKVQKRFCCVPDGGGHADESLLRAVSEEQDHAYFSGGGLRNDLFCFFKNMELCLFTSDAFDKQYFPMFDVITNYDAEVKRWVRDATAVVSNRVAVEWRNAAAAVMKTYAKNQLAALSQSVALAAPETLDVSSMSPKTRFEEETDAERAAPGFEGGPAGFGSRHAELLVTEKLHTFVDGYRASFHIGTIGKSEMPGMPPPVPDAPAIRKIPAGEQEVYKEISVGMRDRAAEEMVPQFAHDLARRRLVKVRAEALKFLYGTPDEGAVGGSEATPERSTTDAQAAFSPVEGDFEEVSPPPPPRQDANLAAASDLDLVASVPPDVAREELVQIFGTDLKKVELALAEKIFNNCGGAPDVLKKWLKVVRTAADSQMHELAKVVTALKVAHSNARTIMTLVSDLNGQYGDNAKTALLTTLTSQQERLRYLKGFPALSAFLPMRLLAQWYNFAAAQVETDVTLLDIDEYAE